jgi:lipooligosaccharide transport system permease protein
MFSASFECTYGSFTRMHYQKTYDAIISTPLNVEDVIAGEIFWGATRSVLTACVILVVVAAFGLVASPWAILVPALAAIQGLLFSSVSLFYTSLAASIYSFNYFFTLFITPMFFFGGVFFPLDAFPPLVQQLSWIAPLSPATKLIRAVVSGQVSGELWIPLAVVVGLTVVFFWLAVVSMRRRLIK